jgi:hypothetical protein
VAAFWFRRMAHETAVHRWDAQLAVRLPEPLESKLAADTVAEALDTFLPSGRQRSPHNLTGLVHLTATDLGQEWYCATQGQRCGPARHRHPARRRRATRPGPPRPDGQ